MAIFQNIGFLQCASLVVVAAVIYLVGSIASYLLQWWSTGRKGDLFAFLFKPWTENRNWLIQRDDRRPDEGKHSSSTNPDWNPTSGIPLFC